MSPGRPGAQSTWPDSRTLTKKYFVDVEHLTVGKVGLLWTSFNDRDSSVNTDDTDKPKDAGTVFAGSGSKNDQQRN
jgi:hypothetical protein